MALANLTLAEGLHREPETRGGRQADQGYVTTNASAASGAGIIDQKRMDATRAYRWPGAPSRAEAGPARLVLGGPGARARRRG
jgi:hypothetical protein